MTLAEAVKDLARALGAWQGEFVALVGRWSLSRRGDGFRVFGPAENIDGWWSVPAAVAAAAKDVTAHEALLWLLCHDLEPVRTPTHHPRQAQRPRVSTVARGVPRSAPAALQGVQGSVDARDEQAAVPGLL